MRTLIRPAIMSLLILTFITGFLYPGVVTAIAQLAFPRQANGSLITADGKDVGSSLIGQGFTQPKYFWSRPSGTGPNGYNGAASSGSNLGPSNPALAQAVKDRVAALQAADSGNTAPVPIDLVTASASGLDPDISPAGAEYQVGRVARVRGLSADSVRTFVRRFTSGRQLGILGEPRVNVLELNLALDSVTVPR